MELNREDMEIRSELFDRFALKDQKAYYKNTVVGYTRAANQVNQIRAMMAFLTGVAAAFAAFAVQTNFVTGAACSGTDVAANCASMKVFVSFLSVMAVILPALGGAFSTLSDLYQWDKLINIYETAERNLEKADALSPFSDMDDLHYRASMRAFSEGTLQIMNDETTQWGQSVRIPKQIEHYVLDEQRKTHQLKQDFQGRLFDASDRLKPEDGEPL
jgi:ABC-type multidrug transport system fused ATPase/permease subunit